MVYGFSAWSLYGSYPQHQVVALRGTFALVTVVNVLSAYIAIALTSLRMLPHTFSLP